MLFINMLLSSGFYINCFRIYSWRKIWNWNFEL